MRKILFLAGAVVLLAASCNSQTSVNESNNPYSNNQASQVPASTPKPNTTSVKVDAAINALIDGISSEQTVNSQSDLDLVNSDATIINNYKGAANANY